MQGERRISEALLPLQCLLQTGLNCHVESQVSADIRRVN
jgi:hypothetical protein